jgi:hypothetical protein
MQEQVQALQKSHGELEPVDITEKGALKEGKPQVSNTRLYMQLLCFTGCRQIEPYVEQFRSVGKEGVVYADVHDPYGAAFLFMNEDPAKLMADVAKLCQSKSFDPLILKPELTMFGKTYAAGREPDLEDWLLRKPRRVAFNTATPWAVWYPLRRKPEFNTLSREDQGRILAEHAILGRRYGMSGLAHDIRLSCYGLDKNDNEFILGVIGPDLHPLSRLIQDMRKTEQTSKYIQSLGPFFVGRAVYQSPTP